MLRTQLCRSGAPPDAVLPPRLLAHQKVQQALVVLELRGLRHVPGAQTAARRSLREGPGGAGVQFGWLGRATGSHT